MTLRSTLHHITRCTSHSQQLERLLEVCVTIVLLAPALFLMIAEYIDKRIQNQLYTTPPPTHTLLPIIRPDDLFIRDGLVLSIILLTAFLVIRLLRRVVFYQHKEHTMLNSIADGLIAIDDKRIVTMWNDAAETLFGVSTKEAIGRPCHTCVTLTPNSKASDTSDPVADVLSGKETSMVLDDQIATHKDGKKTPVSFSIAGIRDDLNRVNGAVIVVRDITKEKEIDRAKTEFVSLASHQLRTPLSAINWYTEMMLSGDAGKLNTEQLDYLKEIYHGNQRMTELVNALLNVSRLELGTFTVEPKPTDIGSIITSVLEELSQQVIVKRQTVKKNIADLGLIPIDQKLMRIIVQNLLTNAIKYTPEDGTVSIGLGKKGKNIELTVSDTGYGIPKDQQSKIFTKLFRADNVREKISDGTGLGLYIIKMILETAGGAISFESKENKGSTFTVTIPLSGMSQKAGSKGLEL